jgi:hypothetical protein
LDRSTCLLLVHFAFRFPQPSIQETWPKISIQHSPIADLEHPFAISLINSFPGEGIDIDSAKGCSKSAIGEC